MSIEFQLCFPIAYTLSSVIHYFEPEPSWFLEALQINKSFRASDRFFSSVFPLSIYILQMETHKFMEGASLSTMVKFTTRIRFGFVLPILPV